MLKLNFPDYNIKTKIIKNKFFVFDRVRKKWLKITPEEWVRVHCVNYLIEDLGYLESWIRIEQEIKINNLKKRFDIVVTGSDFKPYILVECKAHSVRINQNTFDQITRYNIELSCPFLMISNGIDHYFCKVNDKKKHIDFIEKLPEYRS